MVAAVGHKVMACDMHVETSGGWPTSGLWHDRVAPAPAPLAATGHACESSTSAAACLLLPSCAAIHAHYKQIKTHQQHTCAVTRASSAAVHACAVQHYTSHGAVQHYTSHGPCCTPAMFCKSVMRLDSYQRC